MFTGLVEAVGEVADVAPNASGSRLRLSTALAPELANGDSLAVNGVCLTVVAAERDSVHMDVGPETARITTLGAVRQGTLVNLERPLRADSRLGGHFVQGHVDAVGTIEELRQEGDCYWLGVVFPQPLAPYIVRKGSIAVNGISLTVAELGDRRFDVQVIPYTWTHTTLRVMKAGDPVNLECDILGKYVARSVEVIAGSTRPRNSQ